ncbi:MAG: hypothetical protein RLY66_411 [Candidatus Parcubacteria bacterium]|jgi:hypothetical protein
MKSFPAVGLAVVALCVTALSLGYIVFNASPSSPLTIVAPISQVAQVASAGNLTIDRSTPATVKGNAEILRTASFTPPAGSMLYVIIATNSNVGQPNSISSVTDNLGVNTYTQRAQYGTVNTDDTLVYVYTAPVTASDPIRVSVVQQSTNPSTRYAMLKVLVVTGADAAKPIGAIGGGRGVSGTVNNSYTSTRDQSWGWMVTADWKQAGIPVPGSGQSVSDPYDISGQDSYAIIQRNKVSSSAGTSVTLNTTAPTSGAQIAHAYFEMLPSSVIVTPPSDTTAPTISSVSASNISQTGATVSWTTSEASNDYVEYGLTTSYGNSTVTTPSQRATSRSQSLSGLTGGTLYNYRILSRDAAGNLTTSGNYTFTTVTPPDVTAPTIPTYMNVINVTQTSLTLSWAASTDNVAVTGYRVFRNGTPIRAVTNTSFNDSGLTKGTSYTYTVDAYDAAGNHSAQTSGRTVTTLANVAPAVTLSTISVSGTAPAAALYIPVTATDSDGSITNVEFYSGSTLIGADASFPYVYTWTGVAAGTYSITARATDNDGAVTTSSAVPVTVAAAPAGTALLRNWNLNQSSGTTATDSSGNSGTATLVGGPTWTTGVAGNGLTLNGTSAYLNAGNVGSAKFSLSAWINLSATQAGEWGSIIMKEYSFGLEIRNNNTVYASVGNGSTWSNVIQTPIASGVWKHVVQTYDGTTNRLYIDGALVTSGAGAFTNTASNLLIGSWNGSSEYFKGKIDEVRVYNGALSAAEVSSLYSSVTPPTQTSYTVSVTKSGTGTGTVTSTGSINCGTTCTSTGNAGQAVTLTAAASAGSTFAGWSGACTGTATTCSFTLNANTSVNAIFNTTVVTDTSAPTIPANLTATAVSSSQINLSWSASSDNVGVTGYQVFRAGVQIANITPAATTFQNTTGLSPSTSYTYTVRAYDAAGNLSAVSAGASATTQAGTVIDTTAPVVSVFTIPSTSSSLTVPITTLTATDAVGVTGYLITESSSAPTASATGWTSAAPTTYTFTSAGSKTLYAWAKDTAGNVSTSKSASVTVTVVTGSAEAIPADRTTDWTQAGVIGSDGTKGIPNLANCTTNTVTAGNAASIQTAISNCPLRTVIRIPAGTYTFSNGLSITRPVVLRGEGASTILKVGSSIKFSPYGGGDGGSLSVVDVVGGYTKGSTNITLASVPAAFKVNQTIVIDQLNDTSLKVSPTGSYGTQSNVRNGTSFYGGNTRIQFQVVKIKAINGNTITLDNPLYFTFKSSLSPQVFTWTNGNMEYAGIENLKVDGQNGTASDLIAFNFCTNCWVKGVETIGHVRSAVNFGWYSYRGEIRDSYIHDSVGAGPTHYGIELGSGSAYLIENNIMNNGWQIVPTTPVSGSVISYNYIDPQSEPNVMAAGAQPHVGHTYSNLYEGNALTSISLDNGWGSGGNEVILRNRLYGYDSTNTSVFAYRIALYVWAQHLNTTVVGNVLGTTGKTSTYEFNNTNLGSDNVIYSIGYWNAAQPSTSNYDIQTLNTLLRWGNWDSVTNTVRWNVAERPDTIDASKNIPNSLYLASRPSWWRSGLAWPAYGPSASNPGTLLNGKIPAQECFENQNLAGGGIFDSSACYYGGTIPTSDTTAPVVSVFTIPSTSSSLTVPITTLTATDAVGVTGYLITESSSAPTASATGWTSAAPTTYTFASAGSKTLYAWAKDAAGNVSTSKSASVTVTIVVGTNILSSLQAANRTIDWKYTGVPGGIPNRTTICATLNPGATAATINSAISSCNNGVVFLNAGTYNLSDKILIYNSNVTLRGAGADKTILSGGNILRIGSGYNSTSGVALTGGGAKGSSSFTVASTAGLTVGLMLELDRLDDPTFVASHDAGRSLTQVNVITGISGNTITVRNPLIFDFSQGTPKIKHTFLSTTKNVGIEDLKLEHNTTNGNTDIQYCDSCWMKGIESGRSVGYHFTILGTVNLEVRDSYIHEGSSGPNNSGLNFYGGPYGANSNARVENNIFNKNFPAIEVNNSSSGLYIGYNYVYGSVDWGGGSYMVTWTFDDGHAPYNAYNLYEGNTGEMWGMDGYFGGAGQGTLLRNYFTGFNPNGSTARGDAVWIKRFGYYYNIVGNVLGSSQQNPAAYATGCNAPGVYQFGYPNISNCSTTAYDNYAIPSGYPDPKVSSTLVRWGNYDYFNDASRFVASEVSSDVAVPSNQTIPASMIYSSKPSWFPVSVPWPLIGPDVSGGTGDAAGKVNKSPAQLCWESRSLNNSGTFSATTCYPNDYGSIVSGATAPATVSMVTVPSTSSSQSQGAFTTGQQVRVSGTGTFLNIRSAPSATATVLGTVVDGTLGTIVANASNGVSAGGYYWWYVTFNGIIGWVVENYLI